VSPWVHPTVFVGVCVTRLFSFLCCFVFLCFVYLRPVLPVSLDCPSLISPSVFSNVYLKCTSFILSVFTYVVCSLNVKKQSINRRYYLVLFNILICFVMMYYINSVCVTFIYIANVHSVLSQPNCLNVVTENYQLNKMYYYLFSSLINLRSVFYIFI
jgi:hypothetical protein